MIIKDFEATRKAIPVRTFTNFANGSWLKMFGFTVLSLNLNYNLILFGFIHYILNCKRKERFSDVST